MRLWSLHPRYLDAKGLVALWREGLLAQKVLQGATKGYKNHPQLMRFKRTDDPVGAVARYLSSVVDEADRRGYNFDRSKIDERGFAARLPVTVGQRDYEVTHLLAKLEVRDHARYLQLGEVEAVELHPLFIAIDGDVELWEIV
ncbi:pyrimidine dimer DNA glycosylase/endonuclease V [Phytohalomonas tamaricis]|uniref:pyrimidine dimer DNA glycosylase/endonuclease V n=1 Tax=Phytohalomonas tamaricis TaxID=2081032 RepID=UPI000D0B07AD|nr:pyrimidine dimer DNA glycosylase/endonuclease V [Phytohalomonas tamaricis]